MTLVELKKHVGSKNLVLGMDRTMKSMKKGSLKEIFLASNVSKEIKEDIETVAKKSGVKVSNLEINNEEMGVVVKKPFAVSVVSLLK